MITVLYVDDEELNLTVFRCTFRRDFNIITSLSPVKALEMLEQQKVDVIITDQKMPEMTGVQFLKVVNDRFPGVPPGRIIISGYSSNAEIDEAFSRYRLYRFITKPWNGDQLKKIIYESIQ